MNVWRLLFAGDRYALTTRLTASECVARLKAITAPSSVGSSDQRRVFYGFPEDLYRQELGLQPLRGRISEDGFRVGRRIKVLPGLRFRLSSYRMLFQTWANGTFAVDASGTRVTITTTVFRGVGCFWLAVIGMTLLFAFATIGHPQGWPALSFPAVFISLGTLARLASKYDADFVIGLLESTLDGNIVST